MGLKDDSTGLPVHMHAAASVLHVFGSGKQDSGFGKMKPDSTAPLLSITFGPSCEASSSADGGGGRS